MVRVGTTGYDDLPVVGGRAVYTRHCLMDRYHLGRKKLEELYRDRTATGHPEAVGTVEKALAWDAAQWDAWFAGYASTDGLINFDQIAHRYRPTRSTAVAWWNERESNGHPPVARKIGNTLYFDAEQYAAWYETAKAPPTVGNRPVGPDELVTFPDGARLAGMEPNSVRKYKQRPPSGFPQPVPGKEIVLPSGRAVPAYRAGDWYDYARTRGRHGGGRPAGPRIERRYPYDQDPRLDLARQALQATPADQHPGLAAQLSGAHGGASGTWANILTSARQHPTDDA